MRQRLDAERNLYERNLRRVNPMIEIIRISARTGDAMLITPSAVPYDELTPDLIVRMTLDGTQTCEGAAAPAPG